MSSSAITGPILSDNKRAPSGTAAAPSFAFNDSTGTGVYLVSAGVLGLSTNGVQRVVVDASGNVGIGTASPGTTLDVTGRARIGSAHNDDSDSRLIVNGAMTYAAASVQSLKAQMEIDSTAFYINSNQYYAGGWQLYDSNRAPAQIQLISENAASTIVFGTKAANSGGVTERMRIDSNGNLLVGTTYLVSPNNGITFTSTNHSAGGNGDWFAVYRYLNNIVGRIEQVSTTGVSYLSGASDYRLKKDVESFVGGLEKVCAIKPVSFIWKDSNKKDIGFIAHELQEVIPEAVSGEKDAVDAEGNAKHQMVFPAPAQMIASLVSAIQELKAELDDAKAKIAALEAK